MNKSTLKKVKLITVPYRIGYALSHYFPKIKQIVKWGFASNEFHTYTYRLKPNNFEYLLHSISIVTGKDYETIKSYCDEIESNTQLFKSINTIISDSDLRFSKDTNIVLDNRFLHYCIIRANKPELVVENGIEIGFTSILMCEALLRNMEDGFKGSYLGLDIDSNAGVLIRNPRYASVVALKIGDSIESLRNITQNIDYYFSDGERSFEYETSEFEILHQKTSAISVIVSNKLDISNCTSAFALTAKRKHLYFREDPLQHWFPGTHFGIVF